MNEVFASVKQTVSTDCRILALAEQLLPIHGQIDIRREASGDHAYLACPVCLEAYGERERNSRHLAINLEKYLQIGAHKLNFLPGKTPKKKGYAMCMKCSTRFSFPDLLAYKTLAERGYSMFGNAQVTRSSDNRYLIQDIRGNLIPDHPGEVTPLPNLPDEHPAIQFVRSRDYDPIQLYKQFRASFCHKQAPEGEEYGRYYKRHAGQWQSTPQGRVIFYCDVGGMQVCWQGRYLEMDSIDGVPVVWHPYRQAWELRPPWEKGEEPYKYATASSAFRNNQLCGYDAVVQLSKLRQDEPVCVLTEGPLDAARFPDYGLGVLGKHLSDAQARLIALHFRKAVLAFDADEYGFKACVKAAATLAHFNVRTVNFFKPEEGIDAVTGLPAKMDPGKLSYEVAADRLHSILDF